MAGRRTRGPTWKKRAWCAVCGLALSASSATAQVTSIPDAAFEQALIQRGIDAAGLLDGQVETADLADVYWLSVAGLGIEDLSGLQDFPSIRFLDARDNALTHVDLQGNPALQIVELADNPGLVSLALAPGGALQYLDVSNGRLPELDVAASPDLVVLRVANNRLLELDVTRNAALRALDLRLNPLAHVDLGSNPRLSNANLDETARLVCVEVEDPGAAEAGAGLYASWSIPDDITFDAQGGACALTGLPDPRFEAALVDEGIDPDATVDGRIVTSAVAELVFLDVAFRSIENLRGIEDFTSLIDLEAHDNAIEHLDLRDHRDLLYLVVYANPDLRSLVLPHGDMLFAVEATGGDLASLDLSRSPGLYYLGLANNRIDRLDASALVDLVHLDVRSNGMTAIDLRTGNNEALTHVWLGDVRCAAVDDAAAAHARQGVYRRWRHDSGITFQDGPGACGFGPPTAVPSFAPSSSLLLCAGLLAAGCLRLGGRSRS